LLLWCAVHVAEQAGCTGIEREPHTAAADAQSVTDPHENVVRDHSAACEDLRYLGLRLLGKGCDASLGEAGFLEDPIGDWDIAFGEGDA
jgi:hypothetical protein